MKKITKTMVVVLVVAMLATIYVAAFAANSMAITAENVTAKAGEEVTVSFNLENNPGFNYLKVKVSYNSDVLAITSFKDGKLFDYLRPTPSENYTDDPYVIVYSATSDENYSGKVFTITFKVSENAVVGIYDINISVEQCVNEAKSNVAVTTKSAVITIEGETTTTPVTKPPVSSTQPTTKETTTAPITTTTQPVTKETTTASTTKDETSTKVTTTASSTESGTKESTTESTTKNNEIQKWGDSSVVSVFIGVGILAAAAFVITKKREK